MDQTVFNWGVALIGFLGGWVLKVVWDAVRDLRKDIRQIERDLPDVYVRKDDFRSAVSDMKGDMKELRHDMKEGFGKIDSTLGLIFKKLERKEDRDNV